jgi:hypothetical protein
MRTSRRIDRGDGKNGEGLPGLTRCAALRMKTQPAQGLISR